MLTKCTKGARNDCKDVVAVATFSTDIGASNVVGPRGCRSKARLKAFKIVVQWSWAVYAYISGCTKCPSLANAMPHSIRV